MIIDRQPTDGGDGQICRIGDRGYLVAEDCAGYGRPSRNSRADAHDGGQADKSNANSTHGRQRATQKPAQNRRKNEYSDEEEARADNSRTVVDKGRNGARKIERTDDRADRQDDEDGADGAVDAIGDRLGDHRAAKVIVVSDAQGKQRRQRHAHLQRTIRYRAAKKRDRKQDQHDHDPQSEQRGEHRRRAPTFRGVIRFRFCHCIPP